MYSFILPSYYKILLLGKNSETPHTSLEALLYSSLLADQQ